MGHYSINTIITAHHGPLIAFNYVSKIKDPFWPDWMDNVKPCWQSWINLIKENLAQGEIRLHAHRVEDTSKGKKAFDNGFLGSHNMTGHLTHPPANCYRGGEVSLGKGPLLALPPPQPLDVMVLHHNQIVG